MKARILISACLMGQKVRYDGSDKRLDHDLVEIWKDEGRLVTLCPELSGGFQVPRAPAEIEDGRNGSDVLAQKARVIEKGGRDVTAQFIAGAEVAVQRARDEACQVALLIDGSPSCGSGFVYDGSFSGARHAGHGVTAAALTREGIEVFAPKDIMQLAERLAELDGDYFSRS